MTMPDRLIVTDENQIKQVSIPDLPHHPSWIRGFAKIISIIFHPLFIPVYLSYFIVESLSYKFSGFDEWEKLKVIIRFFVHSTFLPLVSVLLLLALKFIDSIFLKTQKERIAPYIICMIFYFWNWYTFKNTHDVNEVVSLSMAMFNASIFGFLANISFKISMHAIAVGVMSTFIALLAFSDGSNFSLYLCAAILITGLVCTSRLIVSDHNAREIYWGLIVGICSQLAAHYFVNS
jgi:hypothetical protein